MDGGGQRTLAGAGALVTGASRGIGRAVAAALAGEGARLVLTYRQDREAAEAVVAALPGGPHHPLAADLTDPPAVERLVAAAADALGRIDVLVNNAGIFQPHPPAAVPYGAWREAWERTLAVNLLAPAHLCYLVAERMRRQGGGGRIVNVSSRGAFRGEPEAPAYGASKAGLNALSQSLAVALAPHGIHVFVVAPGWVETDMAAPFLEGAGGEAIRRQSPLGRVAHPEEVARVVTFLATPGSDFMTGSIIDINGASYLRT